MSCNCNEDHHHHDCDFNCVSNVVRFIHELQECATTTCDLVAKFPLGAHNSASVANTRPFILYTKAGAPFEAFAPSANLTSCPSPVFRVESIDDDDCAVLRVLSVVLGDTSPVPPTDASNLYIPSCTKCKINID